MLQTTGLQFRIFFVQTKIRFIAGLVAWEEICHFPFSINLREKFDTVPEREFLKLLLHFSDSIVPTFFERARFPFVIIHVLFCKYFRSEEFDRIKQSTDNFLYFFKTLKMPLVYMCMTWQKIIKIKLISQQTLGYTLLFYKPLETQQTIIKIGVLL